MMGTLQVLNPQDCQPREAQEFPKTLTCATGGRPVLSEALGLVEAGVVLKLATVEKVSST